MVNTTTEDVPRKDVPKHRSGLEGGNLGLLLAALSMGAVMSGQVIEDLGALAARTHQVRPETVLLRSAELVARGLRGTLEETVAPLARGSALRREIDGATADLGKVVRRLSRAQELCETPLKATQGETGEPR